MLSARDFRPIPISNSPALVPSAKIGNQKQDHNGCGHIGMSLISAWPPWIQAEGFAGTMELALKLVRHKVKSTRL